MWCFVDERVCFYFKFYVVYKRFFEYREYFEKNELVIKVSVFFKVSEEVLRWLIVECVRERVECVRLKFFEIISYLIFGEIFKYFLFSYLFV